MNINKIKHGEIAIRTFKINKDNGFWEANQNDMKQKLMLIITEIAEVVEADRKGRYVETPLDSWSEDSGVIYKFFYETLIKDKVESELAGTTIRCLDLIGYLISRLTKKQLNKYKGFIEMTPINIIHPDIKSENFTHACLALTQYISITNPNPIGEFTLIDDLQRAIHGIEIIANNRNIDLWKYVEAELKYNKTRERKHGKKY